MQVQIYLLAFAILVLIGMQGVHSYLLLRAMGDAEKFGRLLLKVRRYLKGEAAR